MKDPTKQLLLDSIHSDAYLTCACSSEQNNSISDWSSTCFTRQSNGLNQSKQRKKSQKRYIKDCSKCSKLTKNCMFSCRNRLDFKHHNDLSRYMQAYSKKYSTVANIKSVTCSNCRKEEEIILPHA